MRRSQFDLLEYNTEHQIVFIRDRNDGSMSVTNDAENVYDYIRHRYGAVRVVYQDSMGQWDEIIQVAGNYPAEWRIAFQPWNGLAWDILKR